MADAHPDTHDELMAMLKRRGFLQPAYELYGGLAGFYDYGPLGQGLKTRFEALWRKHYVAGEGFGEISSPTVAPEAVFRASGHLGAFKDTLVECPACNDAQRADHCLYEEFDRIAAETSEAVDRLVADLADEDAKALMEIRDYVIAEVRKNREAIEHTADEATVRAMLCVPDQDDPIAPVERTKGRFTLRYLSSSFRISDAEGKVAIGNAVRCAKCGSELHERAHVSPFNLMFATRIGPAGGVQGFLRPETAQAMFVNFDWLYRYSREQVPFGIVQIGRSFRNEIAPRQGLIRLREFWQAEAEVFVDPNDKSHPNFAEIAEDEASLHAAGTGETVRMTLGDAVAKDVIANEMVAYFVGRTQRILLEAGLDPERVRFRQHESDEMAHYAADCWDAEYHSARFGWVECVGIADRGCYDLEQHADHSGQRLEALRRFPEPIEQDVTRVKPDRAKLGPAFKKQAKAIADALEEMDGSEVTAGEPITVTIEGETAEVPADAYSIEQVRERVTGERFIPHVIEPSYGIDRILYAVLEHNFEPAETEDDRAVLRVAPHMAPTQVAVFPLFNKDGMDEKAAEIVAQLRREGVIVQTDTSGSIGRRYARQDEVGTPFCVTVDHQALEDGTVTLRERDSQEQVRVHADEVSGILRQLITGSTAFEHL